MEIQILQKSDFDWIVSNLETFWGPRYSVVQPLHHPMFYFEFGDSAFAVSDGSQIVAYVLGMILREKKLAYIHMVGVAADHRKHRLATRLYRHFFDQARRLGCVEAKAITSTDNSGSIAFHQSLGFELLGEPNQDGIKVIREYRGPGEDRVVFRLKL